MHFKLYKLTPCSFPVILLTRRTKKKKNIELFLQMWLRRFFREKESVIYSASYKGSDFHMSICAGEKD